MKNHCEAHGHFTRGCVSCNVAYAKWKQSAASAPAVISKPGKPFEIGWDSAVPFSEDISDFVPTPDVEILNDNLADLTVPELRKLASQKGITRIDGMPVSNCKRSDLERALGAGSGGEGSSEQEEGEPEYGPPDGKQQSHEIPTPMLPFADAILGSKEFEKAVKQADVMGDVKHDVVNLRQKVRDLRSDIKKLRLKSGSPGKITIETVPALPPPEIDMEGIPNSPILHRIIEHLSNREHVALVGPAGSGKSTLIRIACKALKATLYHTPCGGDIREQHLLGRTIPIKGEWTYVGTPFVSAFESETPSVAMLDEMDGVSDPSVLLPINDVLAGFDKLHLPWRWNAPYAERGVGFLGVAATMNTIGAGATSLYQGRTALDGSTLDRFVGRLIVVPYDAAYEEAYVRGPEGTPATPNGTELLNFIRFARKKIEENNMRRIMSTRMLQQGVHFLRRGWNLSDTKRALLTGWTSEDLHIIGEK